jgi:hypothetical protein
MSRKHRRTVAAVFEDPVRSNILWKEVVSLMRHLGAKVESRSGSRVRFSLEKRTLSLHRPHPGKEIKPYAVLLLRAFLKEAGVEP